MKLTIDFQIKDGRKIISRDTKGYKIVLNRIVKAFEQLNYFKDLEYKVIIQLSNESAKNNTGKYATYLGQIYYDKETVFVYMGNINRCYKEGAFDKSLQTIAHEFGHLYDVLNLGWPMYNKMHIITKEQRADKFAVKMTKRELISSSKTGQTKYSRRK